MRDLTTGYDSREPDKKAKLPASKSSQMVTFYFENGLDATIRTSGTEPKIKYYTELRATPDIRWENITTIRNVLFKKSVLMNCLSIAVTASKLRRRFTR